MSDAEWAAVRDLLPVVDSMADDPYQVVTALRWMSCTTRGRRLFRPRSVPRYR
ncbi:hypothetical protein ACFY71_37720 [Streptomyces cinerochromogenes]|uniref:hypothetical protein n=1 Tax=Streptomyces cinerochromogenes TaxID=66422 RepID=UPI0036892F21